MENRKFRWQELIQNTTGKTSGSGTVGVLIGLISSLGLIVASVAFFMQLPDTMELFDKFITAMGISALLLGVRKFTAKKDGTEAK